MSANVIAFGAAFVTTSLMYCSAIDCSTWGWCGSGNRDSTSWGFFLGQGTCWIINWLGCKQCSGGLGLGLHIIFSGLWPV